MARSFTLSRLFLSSRLILAAGLAATFGSILVSPDSVAATSIRISSYRRVTLDCRTRTDGSLVRVLRSFDQEGVAKFLAVRTDRFETEVISPSDLDCDPSYAAGVLASPFGRALLSTTAAPFPLSDDGIRHAQLPVEGYFLTADLCPSGAARSEPDFFSLLAQISTEAGRAVPVGLSISGNWMRRHAAEFEQIVSLERRNVLSVTWINHTTTHPYRPGVPDAQNFELTPGRSRESEIEGVEVQLLARGELPSVFFRFPGLVSDESWIDTLNAYSLIPIGADAWLAKGQRPKPGSILLVHANGNEPEGIRLLNAWIAKRPTLPTFLSLGSLFVK